MILAKHRLREMVISLLSEDLKFNGPYNDDFNITGVDENQPVIDLTKQQGARLYRFSRIFEALTHPNRQNVAAWKYVAEQMLENRGFVSTNVTRSMPSVFGDTKKDGCLYSVKSSFQRNSNTWNNVIGQVGLNARSLVDASGELRRELFAKHACNAAGMIFCIRKDLSADSFSINWFKTDEVQIEELAMIAKEVLSQKDRVRAVNSIVKMFGAPKLYWQIILPIYEKAENNYGKKLELYDMIDTLPEDKYDALYEYIRGLI